MGKLKVFNRIYPYSSIMFEGTNPRLSHNIAHTLLDFNVLEVGLCTHSISGKEDTHHLDIWANNFHCKPGTYVNYKLEKTPLLWAICKSLDIKYSGGAGESYCQVGVSDNIVKIRGIDYNISELFLETYAYFYELKKIWKKR